MKYFLGIATILLLLYTTPAFATDYYVATDGDNGAAGSIGAPWLTIQKAADTMTAGDTVHVRGGTYTEDGTCGAPNTGVCGIKPQNSGTSGNPITYQEYTGETVIIDQNNQTSPQLYYGFYMEGKTYITIKGFEIKNIKAQGGIRYVSSNYGIVDGVNIHHVDGPTGANTGGVKVDFSSYLEVRNSTIYEVRNNGALNDDAAVIHGIDMQLGVIENNELYTAYHGIFFKRSTGTKSPIVRDNVIHDVHDGIRYSVTGGGEGYHRDAEVYRNVFHSITVNGQGIYAQPVSGADTSIGLDIYNNVFDCAIGVYIWQFKEVNIKNNIFYGATDYSIVTWGAPAEWSIDSADYNVHYSSTRFRLNGGDAADVTYTTLAAWQAATTYGDNSDDSDPTFTNAGTNDYTLLAGSPAINAGVDVGLFYSGSAPDIGAFETDEAPSIPAIFTDQGSIDELGW